jgi:hypothetical protein
VPEQAGSQNQKKMARQEGVLQINGKLGNLSFYKSKEGYLIRTKGGVSAQRLRTDPAFERTRENWVEFGQAGGAAKLVRTALRVTLQNSADRRMHNRLSQVFMKVVQADAVHARGQRLVLAEHTPMLEGFEFNANGKIVTTFLTPYTASIDRASGALEVNIPAFEPGKRIAAPQGTTHLRLVSGGLELDFEAGQYVGTEAHSGFIAWGPQTEPALSLAHALPAGSDKALLLTFGVEYYQEVNGEWYPLKNGAFNSLAVVKVDGGA